jgi:hypothetical protein
MRTICARASAKFASTPGRRSSCPGVNGYRPVRRAKPA